MTDTMRVVPYNKDEQELLIRELVTTLSALVACGYHNVLPSITELTNAREALKKATRS